MKIKVIIFSIAIFLVVLGIVISFNNKNEESINVNAIPIMNKCVVLDAGHGLPDERSCLLTLKITLIFYKK